MLYRCLLLPREAIWSWLSFFSFSQDGSTGDVVEVLLDRDTNSSSIYINGNYSGQFSSATPESVYLEADRVTVFNDSDKLVLAFESGISVQVGDPSKKNEIYIS